MTSTLNLGGRQFRRCLNSTLQHDIVLMNHIRAADVLELSLPEGATGEDYAAEMLSRLASYERFNDLLGCLLVPADLDGAWTPAVGRASATHFAQLTDANDKATLNAVIAELLISFFAQGRVSLLTSPMSSGA